MLDLGLQLILAAGGFIAGLLNRIVNNGHEFKKFAVSKSFEDVEKARKVTNSHIAWTRRIIAITIVFAVFIAPTLVNIFYGMPTYIGYEESNGFLSSLFSGDYDIVWKQLPAGIVLTQYHFSLCSMVLGFYFGKSV